MPLLALVALGALVLPAPVSAGGDPDSSPCRAARCADFMQVSGWPEGWSSPFQFYPNNEAVMAKLVADGRRLKMVSTWGPNRCRHIFRGAKIEAKVKACGAVTPLRVRAYRHTPVAVELKITYAGDPSLDESRSGDGGGVRLRGLDRIAGP